MAKSKQAIIVERLTRSFGENTAVDHISFKVAKGEFFGFLGPNGAGKTTTMRILATLLKPTSGKAWIEGHEITEQPEAVRRSIGFAMQAVTLDSLASAWENLILLGELNGMSPAASKKRAGELLQLMRLTKVANMWTKNYSGGMRRRLDLAAVLMHEPSILFLDEPTEGLDPAGRRVIWEYLKKLASDKGTTLFLTTHYMDEADYLCERIAIMDKGKLVAIDRPDVLKNSAGGGTLDDVFLHYTDHEIQDEAVNTKAADPYIH